MHSPFVRRIGLLIRPSSLRLRLKKHELWQRHHDGARRWHSSSSRSSQDGEHLSTVTQRPDSNATARASESQRFVRRMGTLSTPTYLTNSGHFGSNDTIYAVSTAPGRAAIAVVRISGPACLEIYRHLCPNRPLPKPRTATLRRLRKPHEHGITLDSGALVLYFPAPRTVTGEDILELHVHGVHAIVKAVLEAIPLCGRSVMNGQNLGPDGELKIRYADPGEFTRRAFYNERIDLTQVEALGDVLAAETEQQRRLAVSGSESSLGARYEEWRRLLLYARGELEALIDFSEDQHFDESPAKFMESITQQILHLRRQIVLHIANASRGELLRSGISLALLGAPNAGKSSLLNRIVGREAAIVSAEAGTTRDIIDVGVDIGGWLCRLGDTAGLRTARAKPRAYDISPTAIGTIEKEGIRRARARALQSDVIIAVLSFEHHGETESTPAPSLHVDPEVASAIKECGVAGKAIIIAINKTDKLVTVTSERSPSGTSVPIATKEDILALLQASSDADPGLLSILRALPSSRIVPISCHEAARASVAAVPIPNDSSFDPGNIQCLLKSLTEAFASLTTAATMDNADGGNLMSTASSSNPSTHDPSYWEHSLSVSYRQATNLKQCLDHLDDFLLLSSLNETEAKAELESVAIRGGGGADAEDVEFDIVVAAEHLRFAAACLGKITGRSVGGGGPGTGSQSDGRSYAGGIGGDTADGDGSNSGGDVEEVLGVVFEKFCVGK